MVDYVGLLSADIKSQLTLADVENVVSRFKQFDGGSGVISGAQNITKFGSLLGEAISNPLAFQQIFSKHNAVSEKLSFSDAAKYYVEGSKKAKSVKATAGKGGDSLHSFSEEEKKGYVDYVNSILSADESLAGVLPLDESNDSLFSACGQSLLMAKILLYGFSDALDLSKMNAVPSNAFQKMENHTKTLDAAKKIGCSIVNIAAEDIAAGTPHLVLGVIWQLIKKNLLKQVQELSAAEEQAIGNLPPEQILFKWMNAHLRASGCAKTVANWDKDLNDGVVYAHLMHHIEPDVIVKAELARVLAISDSPGRVEGALEFAERLGCRKFVTVQEVLKGNPRLNLAFVATLFKAYPNLPAAVDEAKLAELRGQLEAVQSKQAASSKEKDELAAAAGRQKKELETLDAALQESTRRLDDLKNERDRLSRERDAVAAARDEAARLADARAAELEEAGRQRDETARLLAQEREERARAQKKLEDRIASADAACASLEEAQVRLRAELAAELAGKAAVEEKLAALEALAASERASAAQAISELKSAMAKAQAEAEAASAELSRALATEKEQKAEFQRLLQETQTALELAKTQARQREAEMAAAAAEERAAAAQTISQLQAQHAALLQQKLDVDSELASTRSELARVRDAAQLREAELQEQLAQAERHAAERIGHLTKELEEERARGVALRKELEEWKAKAAQWEKAHNDVKADLTRQLTEERQARQQLAQKLAEEVAAKELLEDELHDTQDELEEAREEHDDEKALLLQRIADLEEELRLLKEVMDMSLDKAAREKASALSAAAQAKQAAMLELERQREEELRKMRSVITGVTKSGYLTKQSDGFSSGWNKRFFVIQGNILSWYKSEKEFKDAKPKGIIYAEECRVFELGEKKQFGFQLEQTKDGKVVATHNLAASKLDDMKEWMHVLKEAKKKVIAQRVVVSSGKE